MHTNIPRFFNKRIVVLFSAVALAIGLAAAFYEIADAGTCWTKDDNESICCGVNADGDNWCCTGATQEEAFDAMEANGATCHEQTDEEKSELVNIGSVNTDDDTDETGGTETTEVDVKFENPITSNTLDKVVGSLIDFVFSLAVIICPIVIIIGGFIFVTASGDPKKVETGKKVIFWALVGLAVAVLAKGSILLLRALLGVKK